MIYALVGVVAFLVGYFVASYLIARDPEVVRLEHDEVIVKRPPEGLILVAVTQQVARRIVLQNGKQRAAQEARSLLEE